MRKTVKRVDGVWVAQSCALNVTMVECVTNKMDHVFVCQDTWEISVRMSVQLDTLASAVSCTAPVRTKGNAIM